MKCKQDDFFFSRSLDNGSSIPNVNGVILAEGETPRAIAAATTLPTEATGKFTVSFMRLCVCMKHALVGHVRVPTVRILASPRKRYHEDSNGKKGKKFQVPFFCLFICLLRSLFFFSFLRASRRDFFY